MPAIPAMPSPPASAHVSRLCRIGCPVWAHAPWVGRFFTADARREDFLPQYASVFATAEGNATFYGLPSPATVARWREEAPPHFRFCLKFPRAISHDAQLVGPGAANGDDTHRFFERVAPLGENLGPFFLQLHQSFDAARLPVLRRFLADLSQDFHYAVEVRHPDFYDGAAKEHALDELLGEFGVDRVNFDTTGLFASNSTFECTLDAKRRKPRVPLRRTVTGRRPFVRFVGDPDVNKNDAALDAWAATVAGWLAEGREPWFFTHHPDDVHAPELGRRFQRMLHARAPDKVPPPPAWPCELAPREPEQLGLF